MGSGLDNLAGFQLESCRFGLGFYDLEFDGMLKGEHRRYIASTQYNASALPGAQTDAEQNISAQVWPLLGQTLARVQVEQLPDTNQVLFEFEDGRILRVWQERDAVDNLIVVKDPFSDEWFTVL